MKKGLKVLFFIAFLSLGPDHSPGISNSPPVKGGRLPAINLPLPKNPEERAYLGVSGKGPFRIHQIKAVALIFHVVNRYCPACHTTVNEMAELYSLIESNPDLQGKMKLIGIGAGNSPREAEDFKELHHLPFPVLPDKDFTIHKALGEVRTPYTIAVRMGAGKDSEVVYSEPGGLGQAGQFLERILDACRFKKDDSPGKKGDGEIFLAR